MVKVHGEYTVSSTSWASWTAASTSRRSSSSRCTNVVSFSVVVAMAEWLSMKDTEERQGPGVSQLKAMETELGVSSSGHDRRRRVAISTLATEDQPVRDQDKDRKGGCGIWRAPSHVSRDLGNSSIPGFPASLDVHPRGRVPSGSNAPDEDTGRAFTPNLWGTGIRPRLSLAEQVGTGSPGH